MRKLAWIFTVTVLVACGKAGPPRPPVPQIPRAATDLVVAQQGPTLFLSWSFPTLTEAGTTLGSLDRIRVFRVVEQLPATALEPIPMPPEPEGEMPLPPALALFTERPPLAPQQFEKLREEIAALEGDEIPRAIAGGRIIYADTPPLQTSDARPIRLHYAVVFESAGDRSDPSNIASIVALPVPLPPPAATATPEAAGVVLSWDAPRRSILGTEPPPIAGYNVYRVPPAGEVLVLQPPVNEDVITETTYRDVPAYGTYGYRITAVSSFERQRNESTPATVAEVEFRDLEPPPAPQNIVTLTEEDSIRLIWDPVEAPDLAGYKIYRETDRGRVTLTHQPVEETAYRDTRIEPATTYVYFVTSIDENGNESAMTPSAPVLSPR
ncbi:MAG: fibronectin type III domain-containing protein [Thermoanaerobaculia bacterium]